LIRFSAQRSLRYSKGEDLDPNSHEHAHRLGFDFQWQTRFYDHIIRNDAAYQRIANYINTNPENWEQDKFFKSE